MFGVSSFENWTLAQINEMMPLHFKDKPETYVSCELTDFVGRFVNEVKFMRISSKKTICLLTFKNGFDVVGESGCVNPLHYRHDIASKYALKIAVDRASVVIAYQEQNNLAQKPGTETYDKPE